MPDGMPLTLLVERFDIRESVKDQRMLALENLCAVLDLFTEAKYDGTIERLARAVRSLSTAPEKDLLISRDLAVAMATNGAATAHSIRMIAPFPESVSQRHHHDVQFQPIYVL